MKIFGQHDGKTIAQFEQVRANAVDAALMADGHVGYVMPIGGVASYRDQVSVVGIGFDIGCIAAVTPVLTGDGYYRPIEEVITRDMGDDAVIVQGVDASAVAEPEFAATQRAALYSTVHGAGRLMSRTSPHAYRRLPEVLAAQERTVEVLHTLRPLVVAMAGPNEFDPYKD